MQIFNSIQDFKPSKKTIVTIGTFDGVHIGHQKIIHKIVKSGISDGSENVILTFFPHPRMVLRVDSNIKLLNTIEEKSSLLQKNGVENLIIQKFDKDFSELTAEDFVKNILVNQLNIQKIIIGHDHRFGKDRAANINDLIIFGQKYGFDVEQISAKEIDDVSISSTKIRNAIIDGKMELANQYLGYNYQLSGEVIAGKQLGRTIGFPTANISISETYKLIPKNGVYIIKSFIDKKTIFGIMNIGIKPTFDENKLSIEIHFLDFEADLYNQKLTIDILSFIRNEQKFESINDLKIQIEKDKQTAILYLKNNLHQ